MDFDGSRRTEPDKILSNIAKYVKEKLADRKPEEASTLQVEQTNNSDQKSVQGKTSKETSYSYDNPDNRFMNTCLATDKKTPVPYYVCQDAFKTQKTELMSIWKHS